MNFISLCFFIYYIEYVIQSGSVLLLSEEINLYDKLIQSFPMHYGNLGTGRSGGN